MQVLSFSASLLNPLTQAKSRPEEFKVKSIAGPKTGIGLGTRIALKKQQIAIVRATASDPYVDYSTGKSVFPAEACETVGGEACDGEIGPEVKPNAAANLAPRKESSEGIDREYVEYSSNQKTVFPGEACDDLGGEFCEAEYQSGVCKDQGPSK